MAKTTVVYDLGALIVESLAAQAAGIAETLGRRKPEVAGILGQAAPRYAAGEITQAEYWEDAAFRLGLDDTELLGDFVLAGAVVNQELLGRVRVQAGAMTLGLVSDATPDWVGHWRRLLKLDKLFHANIIGSELDGQQSYAQLLELSAGRLQAKPAEVWFVDNKRAHLQTAQSRHMQVIGLSPDTDYRSAFSRLA